jgi:hypothetical protein
MNPLRHSARWGAAAALSLLLAACGGGGDSTSTLSGIAATGAPFAGAAIKLYDRSGKLVAQTTAAEDGSYTLTIDASVRAPLVIEASRDDQTLVSTFARATPRLNVTPLTNLIAAGLAPDGDPLSLRSNAARVTPAALDAQVARVTSVLQPLLDLMHDSTDPLTGVFAANGAGYDKLLDVVQIDIRPAGTASDIEITVKAASDGVIHTRFTSSDTAPTPLSASELAAATLPPDNIQGLIDDLTARMTACFAVPFAQRVSGVTDGVTSVMGGPSSVIAAACRTLFLGDDPANFLSNGGHVGQSAKGGAFSGIFRAGATGVVFDRGRLEFLRNNPDRDVVLSYHWTDTAGNEATETTVARTVDGALKLVGNQYAYNATVQAYAQVRDYLNQPAASFLSTGYDIQVANRVDGSGAPVFSKVEVTSPDGQKFILRPNGGRSTLCIEYPDGSLSATSVVRLAGRFKDTGTPGTPQQLHEGILWTEKLLDADHIRALPEQGVWQLEFFHADPAKANVVQTYRTISRAPTLEELGATAIVELTPAMRSDIIAATSASKAYVFGAPSASHPNVLNFSPSSGGDAWTVPAHGIAPTSMTVFGSGPEPDRVLFDDGASFRSTARAATVQCSPGGAGDSHCDSSTGVTQYAEGSRISNIQLFGLTPRLAGISRMFATSTVTLQ